MGIWVFFGEGAYWKPFFSLSARQSVFFYIIIIIIIIIFLIIHWNFGKFQQKKREKKVEFTLKKQDFPIFS